MVFTVNQLASVSVSADPMVPQPFRVLKVRRETYDTFTLELSPDLTPQPPSLKGKGENSPPALGEGLGERSVRAFAPGQFNMLYKFGVGEVAISISGDPAQFKTIMHTIRAVGPVTKAICKSKTGEVLGVRGPFGSGWPVEAAVGNDILIVAGGVGLAPLRPAIYHILHQREQYGRVVLLYGARTPQDMLYKKLLEEWRGRFDLQVEATVDVAKREEWRGSVGVVTTLIPRVNVDPHHTTALVCGPEVMMRFAIAELQKRGLRDDQIFISVERNMKCAIGFCGHCQYGPHFICKDGPVFRFDSIKAIFGKREI